MNTSLFLSVNQPCDETLQWTKEQLSQSNLRVVQTFDLQSARTGLQDCSCPNHGTDQCNCQMVVLLVYGNAVEPVTLILHGSNGQTWISLVNNSIQHADHSTQAVIGRALQQNPSE
jgi:hypothetical protein